mgnify:CR=1 FL=1
MPKMNIINKKYWYFLFSALIILPGLWSLWRYGLKLSIDFTGGTLLELKISPFAKATGDKQNSNIKTSTQSLKLLLTENKFDISSVQFTTNDTYLIRTKPLNKDDVLRIEETLKKTYSEVKEERVETVGPTIGRELTEKALWAIGMASIAIVCYLAYAFRKVPAPLSGWKFGVCAVTALIHDVIVVTGIFSLLGHYLNVEVDSLFVTALLTIIGFSVHDTIVVFDRIRENMRKMSGKSFAVIVNDSILQTLRRSINTSLTVIFTLLALLFFGGESIRWFIAALLVGIISGTYSSIFNAVPLLVVWEEINEKRQKKH